MNAKKQSEDLESRIIGISSYIGDMNTSLRNCYKSFLIFDEEYANKLKGD